MPGQSALRAAATAGTARIPLVRAGAVQAAAGFARASDGLYVAATGLLASAGSDIPRLEHEPLSGTGRGLLIEPARTNHMLASTDLSDTAWNTAAVTVGANSTTAPDGGSSADTITETTAHAVHSLYQNNLPYQSGAAHTLSVFAKSNGRERLQLVLPSTAFGATKSAVFDLTTGTVVYVEGGADHRITAFAGGWFLCAVTATATSGGTSNAHLRLRDTGGSSLFTGDSGSGVHVWGVQLEVGETASSRIATTGAAAGRAADVLTWTPPAASDLHLVGTAAAGTVHTAASPLIVRHQTAPWTAPAGVWLDIHARTTP